MRNFTSHRFQRLFEASLIVLCLVLISSVDGRTQAKVKALGCYNDREDNRDLPVAGPEFAVPRFCILNYCRPKGYKYGGLQIFLNGTEQTKISICYCGNSYGKYGRSNRCTERCPSDRKHICGNVNVNSVITLTEAKLIVLGCFADTVIDRDLPFRGPYEKSAADCVAHCKSKMYEYAGAQNGVECWCGKKFGKFGKASGDKCDMPCRAEHMQMCGGRGANTVMKAYIPTKKKAARKSRLKLKKFTRVRDELALQYRHKMDWTRNAFKAIGDDAQSEDDEDEESDELVVLSPDDRPDKINATGLSEVMQSHLNYVPTEAIVGLSVAAALLFILVIVSIVKWCSRRRAAARKKAGVSKAKMTPQQNAQQRTFTQQQHQPMFMPYHAPNYPVAGQNPIAAIQQRRLAGGRTATQGGLMRPAVAQTSQRQKPSSAAATATVANVNTSAQTDSTDRHGLLNKPLQRHHKSMMNRKTLHRSRASDESAADADSVKRSRSKLGKVESAINANINAALYHATQPPNPSGQHQEPHQCGGEMRRKLAEWNEWRRRYGVLASVYIGNQLTTRESSSSSEMRESATQEAQDNEMTKNRSGSRDGRRQAPNRCVHRTVTAAAEHLETRRHHHH